MLITFIDTSHESSLMRNLPFVPLKTGKRTGRGRFAVRKGAVVLKSLESLTHTEEIDGGLGGSHRADPLVFLVCVNRPVAFFNKKEQNTSLTTKIGSRESHVVCIRTRMRTSGDFTSVNKARKTKKQKTNLYAFLQVSVTHLIAVVLEKLHFLLGEGCHRD